MSDGNAENVTPRVGTRWEYKVIRANVGSLTFQKYGTDTPAFEATLNDLGKAGWEAFHAQAFAENEVLLLFLKRPAPPALPAPPTS